MSVKFISIKQTSPRDHDTHVSSLGVKSSNDTVFQVIGVLSHGNTFEPANAKAAEDMMEVLHRWIESNPTCSRCGATGAEDIPQHGYSEWLCQRCHDSDYVDG
jgi:hypothetical protein